MASSGKSKSICVHWFRKGLRLKDNPALLAAVEEQDGKFFELRPIFVLDPWFVSNGKVGENRWRFLVQSLQDLDRQLKALGTRLFVMKGSPPDVFRSIFQKWNVEKITFESDTEPYSVTRDDLVTKIAHEFGIHVVSKLSHTLYDPNQVLKANKGITPTTYQTFLKVTSGIGKPPKPVDALDQSNFPEECKLQDKNLLKDQVYNVPTLEELDIDENKLFPCKFPGGETEGLKRLKEKIDDREKWVRSFEKPNTSPNSLEPSTTVLSPYLKFGCVSTRDVYWRLSSINSKGKHSDPPVSLVGQLLWRDFFYTCGATIGNFNKMKGNRICKQIPWREDKEEYLNAWKNAQTGFPFIDAIMTQLRQDGWIHHLARHSVACFLTRGDLWVSWEDGMAVFEELLLDADWSLNAGNWQWLSASAFFHQYFRVYSPVAFGKKTDKTGEYIRKWLPILAKFPTEYIYEPWKAPMSVQKGVGCIIGEDYPKPIVNHDSIHKENIQKMKAAYAGNVSAPPTLPQEKTEKSQKRKSEPKNNSITKYMKPK